MSTGNDLGRVYAVCSVKATMDPSLGIEVGDINGGGDTKTTAPPTAMTEAPLGPASSMPTTRPRQKVLPALRWCDGICQDRRPGC